MLPKTFEEHLNYLPYLNTDNIERLKDLLNRYFYDEDFVNVIVNMLSVLDNELLSSLSLPESGKEINGRYFNPAEPEKKITLKDIYEMENNPKHRESCEIYTFLMLVGFIKDKELFIELEEFPCYPRAIDHYKYPYNITLKLINRETKEEDIALTLGDYIPKGKSHYNFVLKNYTNKFDKNLEINQYFIKNFIYLNL